MRHLATLISLSPSYPERKLLQPCCLAVWCSLDLTHVAILTLFSYSTECDLYSATPAGMYCAAGAEELEYDSERTDLDWLQNHRFHGQDGHSPFAGSTHLMHMRTPVTGLCASQFPNSPILSPSQPYLVIRDTLCSCEAYEMRPTYKEKF